MATTWRWPIDRSPTSRAGSMASSIACSRFAGLARASPPYRGRPPGRINSRPRKRLAATSRRRDEIEFLEDRGDAGRLCLARIGKTHRLAVDLDRAFVGRKDPGKQVHQRRFARAVLAEQRMDLACFQVEIDAAQRLDAAEALHCPCHGKKRFASCRPRAGFSHAKRRLEANRAAAWTLTDAIRSLSRAAACRPISLQGCATRVRRGSKQSAHSKSSKPTSDRSRGIDQTLLADGPHRADRRHVVAGHQCGGRRRAAKASRCVELSRHRRC